MDTNRIKVFHITNSDGSIVAITNNFILNFFLIILIKNVCQIGDTTKLLVLGALSNGALCRPLIRLAIWMPCRSCRIDKDPSGSFCRKPHIVITSLLAARLVFLSSRRARTPMAIELFCHILLYISDTIQHVVENSNNDEQHRTHYDAEISTDQAFDGVHIKRHNVFGIGAIDH